MDKPALSPAEYWEWRTTLSDLELEKEKFKNAQLELKILNKEAEVHHVRTQLFVRSRMEAARLGLAKAESEYQRYKGVLEKAHNVSLNNKIIDEFTYEIRELPDTNTNNAPALPGDKKE